MADCILPPPTENILPIAENQALGPAESLYTSFFLALLLHGGAIARAPVKLRVITRWLSMERRPPPDGADQIREDPPRVIPGLLDPEQVTAVGAALSVAIVDGARSIISLTQRPVDSADSDDEEIGHPNDRHVLFPPIESLETGDACLFFVPGSAESPGDGVYRLFDVRENPWILKAGAESFQGPGELTDETTRTWIMRLKITTKLVGLSRQQLRQQNWEQCFLEVAGQPLEQLLVVACSFSDATWFDVHISQMLTVFDALVDVLFYIQDLRFSRSGEVAGIVNKMVNAFKGVIQRSSNDIRSSKESTIHPATFVYIQVLEFFCRNRDMVRSILDSGDYNTGPCSEILDCLISKLKECAETEFQEKGLMDIFILNNMYYVFQKKCHPGLLPPNALSKLSSLIEQYTYSYLNEYWIPHMQLYLDGDSLKKPRHSSVDQFSKICCSICVSQGTWKVQTELKKILREEIVKLIVPKYVNFLEALQESRSSSHYPSWMKGMWRARSDKAVTAVQLEQGIRDLFER